MREEGQVDRRVSNVGEVFQPRHGEARKLRLREEARGFAKMCSAYADIETTSFLRDAFIKARDIILALCDSHCYTKEKMEGENEKRDLPPTPPIESKAKEEGEKKGDTYNACAREGDLEPARREEHVGKRSLGQARKENKESDEVFETFWSAYPPGRKYNKKKCKEKLRIHYRDAKDKAKFINEFLEGLERWKRSREWFDGFVCCPETFLNQERWLNNPEPSRSAERAEKEADQRKLNDESAAILKGLGL